MQIASKTKIALARLMQRPFYLARKLLGKSPIVQTRRRGVNWELDLREGIDFSIFLLGSFEPSTVRAYSSHLKEGDVVLDIGANIGAHTLLIAKIVGPSGRVIAFEPTNYAFAKLRQNLALNPDLAERVTLVQAMLCDDLDGSVPPIYSSWPLVNVDEPLHKHHLGRKNSCDGASKIRLDDWLTDNRIDRVQLAKMDVDGFEATVLRSGANMLRNKQPIFVMEIAPHVLEEHGTSAEEVAGLLCDAGYQFAEMNTGRPFENGVSSMIDSIPANSSRNVFALPSGTADRRAASETQS